MEYVDFGNVEEVERLKMRKAIDTDLFSLPFQVGLAAGTRARSERECGLDDDG